MVMDADKNTPATPSASEQEQAWHCPKPASDMPWTAADTAFSQLQQWVSEMPVSDEDSEDEYA